MMLVKQLELRSGVTASRVTLKTANRCHLTEPRNSPLIRNLTAAATVTLSSILDKLRKVARGRVGQLDYETRNEKHGGWCPNLDSRQTWTLEFSILTLRNVRLATRYLTMGGGDGDIVAELFEGVCERCGNVAPGREQWMIEHGEFPAKKFFCARCLRAMRIYAIIGFSLLGLLVAGLFVAAWWAGAF